MRIATTQIYTQGVKAFGVQQTKLANLQEQISTGVRFTRPSDDPVASARILELEQTQKLNEQYQENIIHAENRLQLEETTLASIGNTLQRVRELALQGNNSTNDAVSRKSIAVEIDQLREQLLSLANTVDANGDYLFAGHQSGVKPFTENTTGAISYIEFNGDQGQRSINISESRQMNIGPPGRELFMEIPSATALNESADLVDPLNPGNLEMAPAHVFNESAYADSPRGNYQIVFLDATTFDIVDVDGVTPSNTPPALNPPGTIIDRQTYTDSGVIDFEGIRTSITGTPAAGDTFNISPGQYEDMFSMVANLSETLKSSVSDAPLSTTSTPTNLGDIQISGGIITDATNPNRLDEDTFQPVILTFTNTFPDTANTGTATVSTTIANAGLLTGDDYTLSFDGTNWTVTSDITANTQTIVPPSGSFEGLAIDITDAVGAVAGDRFAIKPFNSDWVLSTSDVIADGVPVAAGDPIPYSDGMVIESDPALWQVNLTGNNPQITDSLVVDVNRHPPGVQRSSNIAQTLLDIDSSVEKGLDVRTSIGGRLNALEAQFDDNDARVLVTKEALSVLRDTDLAEAISQLALEQTTLDAAQAVFARITSSSLFNFLR
jgi:flagellar hook-associated protein 3 FlgL